MSTRRAQCVSCGERPRCELHIHAYELLRMLMQVYREQRAVMPPATRRRVLATVRTVAGPDWKSNYA
ncbi:MAG TPA: hypothetical protein DCQ64_28030 [Candidatus Rokubacteria bacterium]|nr:hypothetical protein [Candidatus Rokubacteria bacterium]